MSFISLKHGEVYSVTDEQGNIDSSLMGTGIYYKDTRFLKQYSMSINDQPCIFLTKKQNKGIENFFKLSNGDIRAGDSHYEKMDLEINRSQLIYEEVFYDNIEIINGSQKKIDCKLALTLETNFEDIFEVRGAKREKRGTSKEPVLNRNEATFAYEGLDQIVRKLHMIGSKDIHISKNRITYDVCLEPGERRTIQVAFQPLVGDDKAKEVLAYQQARLQAEQHLQSWLETQTKITTSNPSVNETLKQAELDLYTLATDIGHGHFPVAGIPWFCVPFGRDSILTAVQTLILNPTLAKSTLRTLAAFQGTKESSWNDEAPGKVLHEMRNGEMSNLDEVPFKRYYGSIDATPLFIVLFVETIRWTGDQELLNEILPYVEQALEYLENYADLDGDGFIEFHNQSEGGLAVQSWKDSNHSMVNKDGTYSESPMAVVEVQGYLYDSKQKMAELYESIGATDKAAKLLKEAEQLREDFNTQFWMDDEKFYALSLDKDKTQVQTVTSDPGHALWSEVVANEKALDTADRLIAEDLFSGWGIRTMSKAEKVYSPVAYHNGTVWPHDNSMAVLGFAKYGFKQHVNKVATALFEAAEQFESNRLPELFCGHDKESDETIIPFPVACSPQAWAAGTPYALMQAIAGIRINAFDHSITLSPTLPDNIDWIHLDGIKAGEGNLTLTLKKQEKQVKVEIIENSTGLKVDHAPEGEVRETHA